ncbi:MAG: FAD:protein FMN transferase, partial [Planctomycetota bacterium]
MSACRRGLVPLFLLINTIVFPCACWASQGLQRFEYSEIVMGVEARIVLYCPDEAAGRRAARGAFDRLVELDGVMSDYRPGSELARVCRRAGPGRGPVPVSDDLGRVLEQARSVSAASAGAFDVSVGPLAELWRRARRNGRLPDPDALAEAQRRVGWRSILVDMQSRTLELTRPDMQLDLGGIGKGFAAGQAVEHLARCGVSRCLVDIGGDIATGNPPPGADGWRVAIASKPQRVLTIAGQAVAMSGDTEQYLEISGVRYSHIVDPRSGVGLTNRTAVTVIGPDAATADALASAISVLGADEGLALLDQFPGTSAFVETDMGGDVRRVSSMGFPLAASAVGLAGPRDDRLDWWRE